MYNRNTRVLFRFLTSRLNIVNQSTGILKRPSYADFESFFFFCLALNLKKPDFKGITIDWDET